MKKILLPLIGLALFGNAQQPAPVNTYRVEQENMKKEQNRCDLRGCSARAWLLFWTAEEKGLAYTNRASPILTTDQFTTQAIEKPQFKWNPGVRVALDHKLAGNWSSGFHYVYFPGRAHGKATRPASEGSFPFFSIYPNLLDSDYINNAELSWNLKANILDWIFSYNIAPTGYFTLQTTAGLRSLFFFQKAIAKYSGGFYAAGSGATKMKSSYYGLGPRIGIIPRFILGKGFSFYLEGAISGFYEWTGVHQKEIYASTVTAEINSHPNGWRWNADAAAGFEYEHCFPNNQLKLYASLGADWIYFNRQNGFKHGPQHLPNQGTCLTMWGGNFSTGIKF